METPPTLNEIERTLAALRAPVERQLIEIQDLRDRYVERHRQSAALVDPAFVEQSRRLRRSVREHQRKVDRFPQGVIRTLVLCDRETEELTAIALVGERADVPAIRVAGWNVACVPCSLHLLRCQAGDAIPQGLVVSVNGSPVMDEPDRKRTLDALRAPPVPPLEQKRRDRLGRRLRFERFMTERRIREEVWQEQLFQRRRAAEQREQILRDRLHQQQIEKEEARQKAIDAWDREREVLLHGEGVAIENVPAGGPPYRVSHPIPDLPPPAEEPVDEVEVAARLVRQMPEPSTVGMILVAFAFGCIVGLFVAPKAFSLVGAASAAVAAVMLRLANRRR